MVKGVARQVIVLRPKEEKLFDQAIFLLREDAVQGGVTDQELLTQARRAANQYLSRQRRSKGILRHLSRLGYVAAGAGVASLLWGLLLYL